MTSVSPGIASHLLRAGAAVALVIATGLIGINSLGYHHGDETNYIAVATHMRETGNYLVPIFHGQLILDRALLFYWILAASFDVFGVSMFAARLPSLLAAGLLTAMVYWFTWRTYGNLRGALYAGLATASAMDTCVISRLAVPDTVMSVGIFLSIAAYARATDSASHRRRWLFLASLGVGIAGMAKGHVGIVVSFLPLATLVALTDRGSLPWRDLVAPTTWAPALVLCGWWYVYLLTSGRLVSEFAARQPDPSLTLGGALMRFLFAEAEHQITPGFWGVVRNLREYASGVVIWFLPWSVYVVAGFLFGHRHLRAEWRERRREMVILLTLMASITALFALFVLEVRQPRYLLPIVPGIAILAARFFLRREALEERLPRFTRPVVLAVVFACLWNAVLGLGLSWAVRPPVEDLARDLGAHLAPGEAVVAAGVGAKWATFAAALLGRSVVVVGSEAGLPAADAASALRAAAAAHGGAVYALVSEDVAVSLHGADPSHFGDVISGRGGWATQRFGLWDKIAAVRVGD